MKKICRKVNGVVTCQYFNGRKAKRLLSKGWFEEDAQIVEEDDNPSIDEAPTREELKAKAKELGIKFRSDVKDETLLKKINKELGE